MLFHGSMLKWEQFSENPEEVALSTGTIVFIIILAILVAVIIALYFLGKRMQKQQAQQEEQIAKTKQSVTMLIIDKKRMKLKEAGLPQAVIDSTPKYLRRAKLPIVKAKVGPQILNLVADEKIYPLIPVKREVKAMVSGIYIVDVKGSHGQKIETPQKKSTAWSRLVDRVRKAGHAE